MLVPHTGWAAIRGRYEDLARNGHDAEPFLRLLTWIRDEKLEEEIFAHTSMFDLVISDRPEVRSGENTLRLSLDPKKRIMHFRYNRLFGSTDVMEKAVSIEDSVETLREFLAYKFGVHRNKKNA